ncbi:ATP-dependent helicase [Flexibacterium corallicola]|uniref:ATP-dependent helicase n=1 Tax=Flexibacterium corallicola TaxID=3037259 RepID=UPI00286F27F3|nr:UvrD-helicase domain-containing protein [Pseudovibrio sp. M1P-2-3]
MANSSRLPETGAAHDPQFDSSTPQPREGGIAARAMAARRPNAPAYLEGLNSEQRRAVETIDGPVLVLAGAGTGKTRVLTTRIAHILAMGKASPGQILAVTFTNKAAREMKERVGSFVGGNVEGMAWLGTFHAICVKILRRNAELVGLQSSFSILDTDDQLRLIKQIIKAEGLDEKRWTAKTFAGLLDSWKNRGLTPDKVSAGEAQGFANGLGRRLYELYQERLSILNACDFGDLLLHCITIFQKHSDVLKSYQHRFRYMLVDEYQDTNIAQYLWLRLLAQGNSNVCCVGDDDQSIYGWRGAEVDNILRFEQDFAGAVVIRLERNYRSTSHILSAASHLISHNQGRLGKTLFTDQTGDDEEKVSVASAWDSQEEARAIGDEIESLQLKGHDLNQMAILVRASYQMREFEDRFVTLGLPYRVIGGPKFYERMEIRDALAYFRCMMHPTDDLAFERIVNKPKRGLGEATLKLVHEYARESQIPLMQAAAELTQTEEMRPKARNALKGVLDLFDSWRLQLDTMSHTELAEIILDESGYTQMWRQDRSAEAPGRLDNLKELVRSMEEFESMAGFLEHISLVMDTDNDAQEDKVSIMTLHSAKGLEFDTVFLPGWEEGVFPNQRALDETGQAGLEEERRLAYVGVTRGRKRVKIWFTSNRRIHGSWQSSIPSRFLDELPADSVEIVEQNSTYGGYGERGSGGGYGASRFDGQDHFNNSYSTPGWKRAQQAQASGRGTGKYHGGNQSRRAQRAGPKTIEGEVVAKSISPEASAFSLGERIFHLKFGYGRIETIEGNKLTVDFEKAGLKKVLDGFVDPA